MADSIREVVITLVEAIVLVVVVMFLFLQNWRTTLIPAITIPVSLIGTFAFVKLFGFSINTLTLFGITLATGLVVDDAIVVIENIERHIHDEHRPPVEAASVAMREVTGAVIATALVLAAVFVPVAFFPGTTGRLYQQFALTIAVSMVISAFNALTLTPALSALLLGRAEKPKGLFFRGVNRVIDGGTNVMVVMLRGLIRVRALRRDRVRRAARPDLLGLPRGAVRVRPRRGSGLHHGAHPGTAGSVARLHDERRAAGRGDHASDAGVAEHVRGRRFRLHRHGAQPGHHVRDAQELRERQGPRSSAQTLVGRLFGAFSKITDAMVIPFLPPAIQGLGTFGGFTYELLDQSGGPIEDLEAAAQQLIAQGNQTPGLTALFTQFTANDPQLLVTIDREQAKSLGISLSDITSTMQVLLGSAYVNDFDFNDRSYRVYVQADQQFRANPSDIERYYVRNATADDAVEQPRHGPGDHGAEGDQPLQPVPLGDDQRLGGAGLQLGAGAAGDGGTLGPHAAAGHRFAWSGVSLEELRAGSQSAAIFGLGLLLVYLTLAAQYESLTLPFIILLVGAAGDLGALAAQWRAG